VLDQDERVCLLALIRKMTQAAPEAASNGTPKAGAATEGATSAPTPPMTGGPEAGEVSDTLITG
jgi:hypothetical protein